MFDFSKFFKTLYQYRNYLQGFFAVSNGVVYFHFPTFYAQYKKHNSNAPKRGDALADLRNTLYYLEEKLKRINGKPVRCVGLDLDPTCSPPQELIDLVYGRPQPVAATTATSGCTCSSVDLINFGCRCGAP